MSSTNGSINSNDYQGRYINLSWLLKSQSVVSNNSVISWSLKGAGVGQSEFYPATDFKVVINGITVFSSSSSIELYNGTVVSGADYAVIHNSDGTKTLEIEIEAKINGSIVRGSSSWELPEINRNAIITSCENFTDTEDPRVSFINPNNSTVRINLKANTVLIASRTETAPRSPYTIALTANERDLLRSQTPSSNSMPVIYEIETLLGAETVYIDQASATMRIVEADPTITGITYRDTNPDTIAITGIDTEIIEGNSLLTIDIDTMSALKGANLARLEVTINGETKSIYLSGSSDFNRSVSIGVVNSSIDLIAEIKVIDTRGNSTTRGLLVDFLSWSLPSALISCNRQGNYFSNTDLTVNAVYSPLNNKNSLLIQYQYKESSSSTWSALVTVANNSTTTINLDNTKSYDIRVILTDLIGSRTYNLSVDIGTPIIFFDKDKRSVGINCLPQDQESLEVNGRNVLTELSAKVNRSELATVATTGDYNDLLNKPTVATIDDNQTTANNAWSALKIDNALALKQNSTDQSLNTQDKTIAGSINEVLASIPTETSDLVNDSDYVSDSNYVHTDNNFTNADVTKLSTIETGAEVNVQSDWSQTDTTADDYIKNKPTIPDISTKVSKAGDTMTGVLSYKATNVDASKANNNVSSTQYPTTFNILDNANRILTRQEGVIESSGIIRSYWYVRNYNTSGGQVAQKGITISMDKSGNLTYGIADPSKFRDALGINSRSVSTYTIRGVTVRVVEYFNFYHVAVSGDATSTTSGYENVVALSKGDSYLNIGAPLGGWTNPAQNGQIQWNSGYVKVMFQTTGYKGGFIVVPKSTLG